MTLLSHATPHFAQVEMTPAPQSPDAPDDKNGITGDAATPGGAD
jgi:hypothetical protein